MAGDKTYITDNQGKLHRATRVHAVTPTDIVWSSNPNDYTVQVKIDGKWHRAILTMDAGAAQFFDNINIDKALVTGADGKQHTALIVKPESTVTLSDIKTDTHGTIAGTTTGETAMSTYSENWSDVKWQDNVNVYKVLVTGSDGKVHTALLTTSSGGGVQVIVLGPSPLNLPDAIAGSLSYVKAFGGTEQNGTPTPDAPMDIISNNGVLKYGARGKNLFDATLKEDNIFIGADGTVGSNSVFCVITMPAEPNTQYTLSATNVATNFNRIHAYDIDGNWISQVMATAAPVGYVSATGTTPANTAYIKISMNKTITDAQLEYGATATEYEAPNIGIYTDGAVETINARGKNLYDGIITHFGFAPGTQQVSTNPSYRSIVVKVDAGKTYTFSRQTAIGNRFAYYFTIDEPAVGVSGTGFLSLNETLLTRTFTVPNGYNYVVMYFDVNGTDISGSQMMVELGSTATEYAPYYDGGTATAEMLLKVGDYQDVQSILDGAVTRNVGVKVLDGTEDWSRTSVRTLLELPDSAIGSRDWAIYCTHYQGFVGAAGISTMPDNSCKINVNTNQFLIKDETHNTDITTWKQYLADQYAAGTPVIVVYPLATPTTETVTGQTLQVTGGDNVLEITQASLTGLELEAEYTKAA